mmetsp:Transcript_13817/g.29906  ORF Transcript_13817/g.29906 Transcript_13817/m.29906 type:complete len:115 (-) Transcript_13817:219-563(-)
MDKKSPETIQKLLRAEQDAARLVDEARQARNRKLKEAAKEAEAEIAMYRSAKEKEYLAEVEQYKGSSGNVAAQIAADADAKIELLQKTAKVNREEVIRMLSDLVVNVNIAGPQT